MSEKTISMQNHIGIFDNYISKTNCNKVIEYFKKKAAFGEAYQRFQTEKVSLLEKNDTSVTVADVKEALPKIKRIFDIFSKVF